MWTGLEVAFIPAQVQESYFQTLLLKRQFWNGKKGNIRLKILG